LLISPAIRQLRRALASAAICIPLCLPASGQTLKGFLYDPFGGPWGDNAVGVQRHGAPGSGSMGGGVTFGTEPIGWFGFNVSSGLFSMMFAARDQYPRLYVPAVSSGGTDILLGRDPDYVTGSRDYFRNWETWFAQSFQAMGDCITHVSFRFPASLSALVTIHEGNDPNGPQIGPDRWVDGGYANDAHAMWSAGEVPVVPGRYYTAKIRRPDGSPLSVCFAGGRNMNGHDFPGGRTWEGGRLARDPLRIVVGFDNDGVSTALNTTTITKDFASVAQSVPASGVAGQTFVATGTSVIGASGHFGVSAPFEVSVFESPGPNGLGVNQIGPSKWMVTVAWNARSVVSWAPGEVPTVPGQTYYLRIRHLSNQAFVIYRTVVDEYASGDLYINGTRFFGSDLAGMIACEKSPGSASLSRLAFSDWKVVERTATSATLSWKTVRPDPLMAAILPPEPAPATARIEYGIGTPYTHFLDVTTPAAEHTVTLTGLQPGREYHVRITASAAGMRSARTKDFCFVTEPGRPNLVSNPGFETGAWSPWSKWGSMALRNYPAGGSGWLGGVKARTGNYYAGSESNGGQVKGGIYQRINVDPSRPLNVRACLWTYQVIDDWGGFDAAIDYTVLGRIGIDPTGGTDRNSPNVVWSAWSSGQQWFDLVPAYSADHPSRYTDLMLTVQPQSSQATVFLEAGCNSAIKWTIYAWDDVHAWQDAPAQEVRSLGELRMLTDGTRVRAGGVIVTADAASAGAVYVQQPDRSSGIRVETGSQAAEGTLVAVEGTLATKPSGERFLQDALILSSASGAGAVPMGARCSAIGPHGTGPGNVGLLMRTWGRVVSAGPRFITIDDGSVAGGGLKVVAPVGVTLPATGSFAAVTGVVQLEGTAPASRPVLRARRASDITVF